MPTEIKNQIPTCVSTFFSSKLAFIKRKKLGHAQKSDGRKKKVHLLPCSLALTRLTIGTKCSFSLVLSQTQIRRLSFWKPCCRLLPLSPGTHLISQSFSHSLSLSLFLTHSPTLAHTHIQSLPPSLSNLELPLSCRLFADSLSLSLSLSPPLPLFPSTV